MIKRLLFILFLLPLFAGGQTFVANSSLPIGLVSRGVVNGTVGMVANNTPPSPVVLDPNAQAYLDSAVFTNAAVRTAISNYVIAGKANGWWTLLYALYPCVSDIAGNNTASLVQMKWNLKNPANTDAAFRLTYNLNSQVGDPTASPSGLTFVPATSWANTYMKPASTMAANSQSIGYYSASTSSIFQYDMGTNDFIGGVVNLFLRTNTNVLDFADQSNGTMDIAGASITNTQGMIIATRTGATALFAYRNGTQVGTGTAANQGGGLPNQEFFLGTIRNGGTGLNTGSTKTYVTFFMAAGMSPTVEAAFTTDTNTLQAALESALGLSGGTRKTF